MFFNVFFEAKPFAAILIAHGTHQRIQEFVLGRGTREAQRTKIRGGGPRAERGSWGPPLHQLGSLMERCMVPQQGSGQSRAKMHFGHTKSPENVFNGRKCRFSFRSRFDSAEPLDATEVFGKH